ncbi:MAG: hypothetical protein WB616_02595 [Candidatus Sulfotelmatobacter sp.]
MFNRKKKAEKGDRANRSQNNTDTSKRRFTPQFVTFGSVPCCEHAAFHTKSYHDLISPPINMDAPVTREFMQEIVADLGNGKQVPASVTYTAASNCQHFFVQEENGSVCEKCGKPEELPIHTNAIAGQPTFRGVK